MIVNSATIGADWFLNGLDNLQARQLKTQKELSSGYAVSTAADNPAATHDLVNLGSSLTAAQTYQSNLINVQAEATAADGAISSAIGLLQSAQSIATRGASSTSTATVRQSFAVQVQAIQQQLVSLANTNVGGRFIFGGDRDGSAPYRFTGSGPAGTDVLSSTEATRVIVNPSGQQVYQPLRAAAIFDPSAAGTPTAGNSFVALQSLQAALVANDPAGIGTALASLGDAFSWLNRQQVYYGAAEQRLSAEQNAVGIQLTRLETNMGDIRDANIAQAATDLAQESTSLQAALAAQAAIPRKSLFDYLG